MVDDTDRERAIYHALEAIDEVAAAVPSTSTTSLNLLRQARERLGEGRRTIEADTIAHSDAISLRRE